jgi:hypothetical protein
MLRDRWSANRLVATDDHVCDSPRTQRTLRRASGRISLFMATALLSHRLEPLGVVSYPSLIGLSPGCQGVSFAPLPPSLLLP